MNLPQAGGPIICTVFPSWQLALLDCFSMSISWGTALYKNCGGIVQYCSSQVFMTLPSAAQYEQYDLYPFASEVYQGDHASFFNYHYDSIKLYASHWISQVSPSCALSFRLAVSYGLYKSASHPKCNRFAYPTNANVRLRKAGVNQSTSVARRR